MIVKNEAHVIRRCLASARPFITHWVIVDTGSTDDTREIIKNHLKDIPGELHERPWRNFGENRSEAFDLAKGHGDYILFMDADDILSCDEGFQFPPLTADVYNMWRGSEGFTYQKPQLAKASLPFRWVGVTHEYLDCPVPHVTEILENVRYVTKGGGASAYDPEKFLKNIRLLTEGLKKEPDNRRYVFYLAESYRDAGEKGKALEWYQKMVDMGGWDEEIFWSMLQIGHMLQNIGLPAEVCLEAYKKAHAFRPHRAEPVYYMAELYNRQKNYSEAYECLKAQEYVQKPAHKDALFNMDWIEEYGLLFQLSICSYYVGNYEEALKVCDRLLALENLPGPWRELTEKNRLFPLDKLKAIALSAQEPGSS